MAIKRAGRPLVPQVHLRFIWVHSSPPWVHPGLPLVHPGFIPICWQTGKVYKDYPNPQAAIFIRGNSPPSPRNIHDDLLGDPVGPFTHCHMWTNRQQPLDCSESLLRESAQIPVRRISVQCAHPAQRLLKRDCRQCLPRQFAQSLCLDCSVSRVSR